MDEREKEERKKSSADYINDAFSWAQRALMFSKKGKGFGLRGGGGALRLGGLAARAAVGASFSIAPILIAIGIIIGFIVIFFFFFFGGGGGSIPFLAVGVDQPSAPGPGDSGSIPNETVEPGTVPPPPTDIRQGLIDEFGITMNGFDEDHLLWTWERFWEVSPTKFTQLLRGARIDAHSSSSQVGCFGGETSVLLGQYPSREFFKFILLHELGHVIQACQPRSISFQIEQMNAYDQEGPISYYAEDTSRCIPGFYNNYNEDYADMVAYYLDRSAGFSSAPRECGGPRTPPNPYQNGGFPLHMQVAQNVLQ